MTHRSPYGFGMLRDVKTNIMLRGATREELIASLPLQSGEPSVEIAVTIDGTTYQCKVYYHQ